MTDTEDTMSQVNNTVTNDMLTTENNDTTTNSNDITTENDMITTEYTESVLTDSHISAMDIDNTLSEEDKQAQESLDALKELLETVEKLSEDNTQYELHLKRIELAKKAGLPEELENARENMHQVYAMSEDLWLDWIKDTHSNMTAEDDSRLLWLYSEAEQDYLSINIWKSYVEYISHKFHQTFDNATEESEDLTEYIKIVREDIMKAVRATSHHIKGSQQIWKLYSQFEMDVLEKFKTEDQKKRVQNMYLARLDTLHMDYEDTFNSYSSFITAYDNEHYEDNMIEANKIYASLKVAAEARDIYEQQLISTGYSLDAFYQYIENEKYMRTMSSVNNVRALYERAIVYYCTDVSLWDDYIIYLIDKARVSAFIHKTILRSIRNCPWSGILWAHYARWMESEEVERETVIDLFDNAMATKPLTKSLEDLVTVLLAKCDYERRQIDWEYPDNDQVLNLCVAFEESLDCIEEAFPSSRDPYCRIEKYYAYISANRLDNIEKARELWESIISRHGYDTESYIQYIYFERDHGDYEKCETIFKRAIAKKLDNPVRLIDVWNTIEHEIGTLQSYEEASIRINQKTKKLTREWQDQLYKDQERLLIETLAKEERELEKKRKKGLRRMDNKIKLKEKKKDTGSDMGDEVKVKKSVHKEEWKASAKKYSHDKEENSPKEELKDNVVTVDEESLKDDHKSIEEGAEPVKRKLSDDDLYNVDPKKVKIESEGEQPKDEFVKPTMPFRPRKTTKRAKAITLAGLEHDKNDMDTPEDTVAAENETPVVAKSNNDFRAMLLDRKKKHRDTN
ncbi:hypothetical protein BDB01DRAFT_770691 [Pilobolus umbonatus]|nr:hypothetical protein BDB01DRAFT_770691 [Pilobolus umbonatus]